MKVLLVNSVCGIGSTGRICTDLYKLLTNQGHECVIAYGRGNFYDGCTTYKIGGIVDQYEHVLETRVFDNHGFASRYTTKKFIEYIDLFNPDIIHLHNIHGYYVNVKILIEYLVKSKKEIVWTFHDCWPFSPHSAYIDFDKNGMLPEKNSGFLERFQYPSTYIYSRSKKNYIRKEKLFKKLTKLKIVTPSFWLENMVEKSFFQGKEISTIHNGIDLNIFFNKRNHSFREKYKLNDKIIILGVANIWEKRKGLSIFNKLVLDLTNEYKIVLVGKLPKGKKVDESILHISQTKDSSELSEIYRAADIFVNPTNADNYPTTNLEALASGLPVITMDNGGTKETIQKGRGIACKNYSEIIEAIKNKTWFNELTPIDFNKIDKNIAFEKYIMMYREIYNDNKD